MLVEFGPVEVRAFAAVSLGLLLDRESRASIRPLHHPPVPADLRHDVARAVGVMTDREAEMDLLARLEDGTTESARAAAAVSLGKMGALDAVPLLTRTLRDRGSAAALRAACAIALGDLLDPTPDDTPFELLTAGLALDLPGDPDLAEVLGWL
jgi:HEAT repeat protein